MSKEKKSNIIKQNYAQFIECAKDLTYMEGYGDLYLFDLEGLARIIDIAVNEGRIEELTLDPEYSYDPNKVKRHQIYQMLIRIAKNHEKVL